MATTRSPSTAPVESISHILSSVGVQPEWLAGFVQDSLDAQQNARLRQLLEAAAPKRSMIALRSEAAGQRRRDGRRRS